MNFLCSDESFWNHIAQSFIRDFSIKIFSLSLICFCSNDSQSGCVTLMTNINSFVDLMNSNSIKFYLSMRHNKEQASAADLQY